MNSNELFARAASLASAQDWRGARSHIASGLAVEPQHSGLLLLEALALMAETRYEESQQRFEGLLSRSPENAELHNYYGALLRQQGDLERASSAFQVAVALNPDFAEAHNNLGRVAWSLGHYEVARTALAHRTAQCRQDAEAHFVLCELLLGTGRFREGWRLYQLRPSQIAQAGRLGRTRPYFPVSPMPRRLNGERMLLAPEQGVGDFLFFLRFLPMLKARGGRSCLLIAPRLARFARESGVADEVIDDPNEVNAKLPFATAMGDLPFYLECDREMPPSVRFSPLPDRVQAARVRLQTLGPGPYIGVNWAAGTPPQPGARFLHKRLEPAHLGAALAGLDATVVVLQRNPDASEIERFRTALGQPAPDLSSVQADLEELLAYLAVIDELVGVSSTSVHLRAAIGLGARVLCGTNEWRWMFEGARSPWFPESTVYRLHAPHSAATALADLRGDLQSALRPAPGLAAQTQDLSSVLEN